MEGHMKPVSLTSGISRRVLLSTAALLPMPALLRTTSALSQDVGNELASWNNGPAKQAIVDFVRATTDSSNPQFVPQALYDEAKMNGWTVISTKNDWKRIFSFD
jgi:hypothetical protein